MNANGRKLKTKAVTEQQMNQKKGEEESGAPNDEERRFIGQDVVAEKIEERQKIVVEKRFPGNGRVKPGGLKGVTDNVALQKKQVPARLIEKTVSVPGRRAEMPQVCGSEKEDPENKKPCLDVERRLEAGNDLPWAR